MNMSFDSTWLEVSVKSTAVGHSFFSFCLLEHLLRLEKNSALDFIVEEVLRIWLLHIGHVRHDKIYYEEEKVYNTPTKHRHTQ